MNKLKGVTVSELLKEGEAFVCEQYASASRADVEVLLAFAMGRPRKNLLLQFSDNVPSEVRKTYFEALVRRARGEPVAYITGETEFFGRPFEVGPGVLVPRQETEQLADDALRFATSSSRVVDFGSGSGCLAITIALEAGAKVLAVEKSQAAVSFLKKNATKLGGNVAIVEESVDSLQKSECERFLGGPVDIVVANPPYVEPNDESLELGVKLFEPKEALFSENGGLAHLHLWCLKAGEILKPGGHCFFEFGFKQGQAVRNIFLESGLFEDVAIKKDYGNLDRWVHAVRK